MPRQLEIANALRTWGLNVVEVDGWRERGVSSLSPQGVVVHHTGAGGDLSRNTPSLRTVIEGRKGEKPLPGPLCNVLQARNADCYVIASGVSNNAGTGGWQPGGPGTPRISGNSTVFGLEIENNGTGEPYTPELYDGAVRATAALLQLAGRGAEWACGHKEWTPRKIDPLFSMVDFRHRVTMALQRGPSAVPEPDKLILPADREQVIIEIQQILAEAGHYPGVIDGDPGPFETSLTRHGMHAMKNERVELLGQLRELKARVEELQAATGMAEVTPILLALRSMVRSMEAELAKVKL